jgi:aminoglycoside phosphotransferase (APT) family kinase protein
MADTEATDGPEAATPEEVTATPDSERDEFEITRTTRDQAELRERLDSWLAEKVPGARISKMDTPDNGMSSETLLFEMTVEGPDGETTTEELVARLAAADDAVPVFPRYDIEAQYEVMDLVGKTTSAPVPGVRFLETDTSVLGAPFLVMDRVHGRVPPDSMPYTMEGFMLEATPDELRRLQDASVDVLAEVHRTPLGDDTAFLEYDQPGDTALRRHYNHWKAYAEWASAGRELPVLAEAEAWLEANWPTAADSRPPVLSWGDSRIGNMLYDGFDPVAVLDWEMATIAPREADLAWMVFLHTFFQDITEVFEMPGLPDFMATDDVVNRYEEASGTTVEDFHWFYVYAAYRHGAVMVRIYDRRVHFGDAEESDDVEEAIMHRDRLRQLIES